MTGTFSLSWMSTILKWIGYLLVVPMLIFAVVPYSNPALNPFLFAILAGAAFVDAYVAEGVQALFDRGQHWKRHFLPPFVILHLGVMLSLIGRFYSLWTTEALGLTVLVIGVLYCANQIDRAIWHPVDM